MNENFLKAQDICIEHAAQICDLLGLSDGMARILALLYMSPEASRFRSYARSSHSQKEP